VRGAIVARVRAPGRAPLARATASNFLKPKKTGGVLIEFNQPSE
jgi:hypothetical protein